MEQEGKTPHDKLADGLKRHPEVRGEVTFGCAHPRRAFAQPEGEGEPPPAGNYSVKGDLGGYRFAGQDFWTPPISLAA